MRAVLGIIVWLALACAAQAQVINGEGNFESNNGFDRAPDDARASDRTAKPVDRDMRRDDRQAK